MTAADCWETVHCALYTVHSAWVFVAVGYVESRAVGLISRQNFSGLPRETRIYFSCVFVQLEGMLTLTMVGMEHVVPPLTLRSYQTAKSIQLTRNSTNAGSRIAFGLLAVSACSYKRPRVQQTVDTTQKNANRILFLGPCIL
jgi:hypothetical protein